jgi:hypothetical protein
MKRNAKIGTAGHSVRNLAALAAWDRPGGPMKDRRTPRGGASNLQAKFLEMQSDDEDFDWDD